jgi:hypothetical protein
MTATAAVPAPVAPRVDPEAAVELVGLVARQLTQVDTERTAEEVPLVVGFLAVGLEEIVARGRLAAFDVELLHESAWRARRLDLVRAFRVFNPEFGPVHAGCWGPLVGEQRRQAAAQRRELELSMGERFARLLPPAEVGEAS